MENNSEINNTSNRKSAIKKAISENSLDTGMDLLEVWLDDLLKTSVNEISNEIPVIKTISSVIKTGVSKSFASLCLIQQRPMVGRHSFLREDSSLYLTNDRGRCFLTVLGLITENKTESSD